MNPWSRPHARIVVFRALQLGDMLCTVPALRALRVMAPTAEITWVGLPSMASFAARYPHLIDDFVAFPGADGFPEQPYREDALEPFIEAMRARRFDAAINLHGDGTRSNALVARFGAGVLAGSRPAVSALADDPCFEPWAPHESEVRTGLAVMRRLGASEEVVGDVALEMPVHPSEHDEWRALARAHALDGADFVCIHPGARWSSRRWPLDRFAAVAIALARRGLRVVVTGSADERALVAELVGTIVEAGASAVDLSGRTSLGALGALLRDARLLVSNDTGISHVAAAMRTPSVVIASGSDVARWAPLNLALHRVLWQDVPCRPCMFRDCPIGHPCALGVTVDAVVAAVAGHSFVSWPASAHAT